jgi:hypothetical protein
MSNKDYEMWREHQLREEHRRLRDEADEKDQQRRGGREDEQWRPGKGDEWGGSRP